MINPLILVVYNKEDYKHFIKQKHFSWEWSSSWDEVMHKIAKMVFTIVNTKIVSGS